MNKIILFGLVFLVLITSVSATNFVTGDEATLFGNCILPNGSLGGDNMTLTAYYENTTVFLDAVLMEEFATGQYNYTFIVPNSTGTYPYSMTCYFDGDSASANSEFIVLEVGAADYIDVDNAITVTVDNQSITAVIAAQIFLVLIMIGIAFIQKTDILRFFGFAIGLIELILMVGFIYANELEYSMTGLMRINFIALLIILFVYGMYSMWVLSIKIGTIDGVEIENEKGKWNKRWKTSQRKNT